VQGVVEIETQRALTRLEVVGKSLADGAVESISDERLHERLRSLLERSHTLIFENGGTGVNEQRWNLAQERRIRNIARMFPNQ